MGVALHAGSAYNNALVAAVEAQRHLVHKAMVGKLSPCWHADDQNVLQVLETVIADDSSVSPELRRAVSS